VTPPCISFSEGYKRTVEIMQLPSPHELVPWVKMLTALIELYIVWLAHRPLQHHT
jgi:hypothetical protein